MGGKIKVLTHKDRAKLTEFVDIYERAYNISSNGMKELLEGVFGWAVTLCHICLAHNMNIPNIAKYYELGGKE